MVRQALITDLVAIEDIYAAARKYMADNGNPTQWHSGYPPLQFTMNSINAGDLYVVESGGSVHGVFAFIIGEDPSYSIITDGCWKYSKPYGTIHRIASNGTAGGVFDECMMFCKSRMNYLRIDTHENNRTMLHCIEKHGFIRSGIVYMPDGSPRIAFEYMANG